MIILYFELKDVIINFPVGFNICDNLLNKKNISVWTSTISVKTITSYFLLVFKSISLLSKSRYIFSDVSP